jgi:hypothetical protein
MIMTRALFSAVPLLALTIRLDAVTILTPTSSILPGADLGFFYSVTFGALGGVAPYTWSLVNPTLPTGLTINSTTGVLSGTPTGNSYGGFGFTVQVTDTQGAAATRSFSFDLNLPPLITNTSLRDGTIGGSYGQPITIVQGTPPYTISITSGSPPPGINFDPTTNRVGGVPSATGTYTFTIQVSDAAGGIGTTPLTLAINPLPTITTASLPNGTLGTPYSVQLTAMGGTPPLDFGVRSPNVLPASLTLYDVSGVFAGTPSAIGTFPITFLVVDSNGRSTTKDFTLNINPPSGFTIITGSALPDGTVGSPYTTTTLSAYSGSPPLTWTISAGQAPLGLALTPGGVFGGAPTQYGNFSFTVQATDSTGLRTTKDFMVNVHPAPLTITTTAIANGVVGVPYQQQITATGGVPPYQYFVSPDLPFNLILNSSTGVISGTIIAVGNYMLDMTVVDSQGARASKNFPLPVTSNFAITSPPLLPSGIVQRPYSFQLSSAKGVPPLGWYVSSGSLPPGLSLDPPSGTISGMPLTSGVFTFTVYATDQTNAKATQTFALTINPNPILITTSSLAIALVNTTYSQPILTSGGIPPFAWAVKAGSLPANLILNPSTGLISGIIATAGAFPFTVQVTDSTGAFATKSFAFQVYAGYNVSTDRQVVNIGTTADGSTVSGPQTIAVNVTPPGPVQWTVTTTDNNIVVSPAAGARGGLIQVWARGAGPSGQIVIHSPQGIPSSVGVSVKITTVSGATQPFGFFDTPLDNTPGVVGAIPVTGWALDNIEVTKVDVWREPVGAELPGSNGLVYVGDAVFVDGARPDVESSFYNTPLNYRAGWGYMLLTNFLPNAAISTQLGNGVYHLHAIAHNKGGTSVDLGTRTITVDNAHASKPFGTIDSPAQGGSASGNSYINFGWALTQNPNQIALDGSTISVYVDGQQLGHPVYNQFRSDIASLFPGLANSKGAVGFYYLDTTALSNGVHTISWTAFDNAGHGEGLGSRYFNAFNTSPTAAQPLGDTIIEPVIAAPAQRPTVRRGHAPDAELLKEDESGDYPISIEELERIELGLGAVSGYLSVNGQRYSLPIGSSLKDGTFYWQLGPGFLGRYSLEFERADGSRIRVRIKVLPKTSY